MNFYSINDGNQNDVQYQVSFTLNEFKELKKNYDWEKFNEFDNLFWEYAEQLLFPLYESFPKNISEREMFFSFTRAQKTFHLTVIFVNQVDNGGVYQFIFNQAHSIFALHEALEEIGIIRLMEDYEKVLEELVGKQGKIYQLRKIFNDSIFLWEQRWNSFVEGYKELPSTKIIEEYFYTTQFKKQLYKSIVNYVDKNISQFLI